ncbi:MAG: cadherin domain-containing protein, partial [Methylococcales bacterium]|nr:cadherin domain-containing protein [Methylococcales bacterium]
IQSVQENSVTGTVVGFLSANDPDPGDTLTYSIVSDLSSNFEIIGREIRVKTGATLNYEAASSHIITIRVTDSGGLTYDEDVTIQVTKINEAPSFGAGDGIVTTSVGSGDDWARAMILQDDGKAIVAGYGSNGSNDDFALVRYNLDGSLDTTFGTAGKVITTFDTGNDKAYAVTIQNDGKILVAGHSLIAGSLDFAIARYNIDGSLDTSFSSDGKATVDFSSSVDYAESITVQTVGKILIAGMAGNEYAVIRLESDGTLDSSFGSAGKVTTDVDTGADHAYALAVQTNGMIVLAGSSNSNFAIVRYDSNGNLDAGFGTSGKVTTDFASSLDVAKSLIIQSDGKILVGGYANNGSNLDFALARYHANGSLDTLFSGDGKLLTDISNTDISQSMTQQTDGKVILAGYDSTNTLTMIRYETNGDIDTTFGSSGKVTQAVGSFM